MQIIANWKDFKFTNHMFFNCSNELNNIIEPLIRHFGLNSFIFQKIYNDGSEIHLTNQPKWTEYFLSNKLYQKSVFEARVKEFKQEFVIWSHIPEHSPVLDEAKKHGIDYGITLTNKDIDGVEFYFLGTTTGEAKVINKYISNIDLLEKFTIYFKNTARELIKKAYAERFIINDKKTVLVKESQESLVDRNAFLMEIMQINLTNRELDCANLLAKGFTAKMIAIQLNLSYRTIEEYINNLKHKTGKHTKAELVNYFNQWFS